jgi:Na+/melibiose symporter-like transporter
MPAFVISFAPFNKLIAMTVPTIYAVIGFASDWDVLYNDAFRNKIFLVSIIIVLASTVLSIISFFFYDLSEEKHKKIIEDLKLRANDKDSAEEQGNLLTETADAAE